MYVDHLHVYVLEGFHMEKSHLGKVRRQLYKIASDKRILLKNKILFI